MDTDGDRVASVVLLLPSDGVTVLRPRDVQSPRQSGHTVVLVESDPTHRRLLQTVLRGQGHDVETVRTAEEAGSLIARQPEAVLVADRLPGTSSADGAAWLAERPALRLVGTSDEVARVVAIATGAHAVTVERPLAAGQIIDAVQTLVDAGLDADVAGDEFAAYPVKLDRIRPIHPLEAS